MRVAALDLGSNSFLLFIAEVNNGKIIEVLHDEQRVTRLGQGVHENRVFHLEALKRAADCFSHYKKIIDKYQVERVQAVSTSAARDVKNKQELIDLGLKYSIPIEIISGDKEAELTFSGSVNDSQEETTCVVDVGGGSTEIIGREDEKIKGWSFDIGSVRLAEIFDAFDVVSDEQLSKIDDYIIEQIKKHSRSLPIITKATAVAGTPTTLSSVIKEIDFDPEVIEGSFISRGDLAKQQKTLAAMSLQERKQLKGVHPDRADVLVCGVSILKNICQHFDLDGFSVSCKGVRFGLAIAMENSSF